MGNEGGVHLTNPFERLGAHARPEYAIEPLSIAWNAVVFQVSGSRQAVVCVPRDELDDFLDRLHSGELDASIVEFLESPPANRVLKASDQAGSTGLFDQVATPDAVVPPERTPGRARPFGGNGGTPREVRENKGRRGRRFPRGAVAAVAIAAVVVVGGVAVALSGGGGSSKPAAVATTTTVTTLPTTTTTPPALLAATALEGSWTVTRTITASTNPRQPVGDVSVVQYTVTKTCTATACTLHLDAPGTLGAHEEAELTFSSGSYQGAITGSSPCISDSTGEQLSVDTITGSIVLTPTTPDQFGGELNLTISDDPACGSGRSGTFALAGQR